VTIDSIEYQPIINQFSRLDFINSQINNRYNHSNIPPYVVHIESKINTGNIGNLHPMKLDKMLANGFSFITDIWRIGKNEWPSFGHESLTTLEQWKVPLGTGVLVVSNSMSKRRPPERNIISVNFKYRHEDNSFVENDKFLPDNWISYIPNFKIFRTGFVKGVDLLLSEDEIQGIKFPGG